MDSETASPCSPGPNDRRDGSGTPARILSGKPVSPGYARGHAVVLGQDQREIARRNIAMADVEQELGRFRLALETSRAELQRLSNRVQSELGMAEAEIFSAHLLFLQDPHFIERVEAAVRKDLINIEAAIDAAVSELAQLLREADDAYLREREEDVRDLGRRVLRHVAQRELLPLARLGPGSVNDPGKVLAVDLQEIGRPHPARIITERGGEAGHAAILARSLGIPAVTGVMEATRYARTGAAVLLDGLAGAVLLNPTEEQTRAFVARQAAYEEVSREAQLEEQFECVTSDGARVSLCANLGREDEIGQVAAHCLDGIGLFRTEYLFLTQSRPPSFEQQRQLYQSLAGELGGKPLVIRTLDLGGDKYPTFLAPHFETNPNLGLRGLRFSLLVARDLFRNQVRAIVGLYPEFDVSILLPMVLGGADLRAALAVIRDVAAEEGIAKLPPIGALIETPSAVFAIDDILAQADFVSIGTNDLTQFILAADRNALSTMDDYTVLHPSVLRAMRLVIRAADATGTPISVCGEAAGDPDIARLLVGLGVRRLSMSPVTASRVRSAIRASAYVKLQEMAEAAVAFDSAEFVANLLGRAPQDPL